MWIKMMILIIITVLTGCEQSGGTSYPSVSPAGSSFEIPSTASAPPGKPFDIGGAAYAIKPAGDVGITGSVPRYQVDATYFADDSTGWLMTELAKGKLALLHTIDGGSTWHQKELPGERGEAVHFVDETKGFALVSVECGPAKNDTVERCGEERLLYTTDGGDSWEEGWKSSGVKADFTGAELALPGGTFALTKDGTLLTSHDKGRTWKPAEIGSDSFRLAHMSFVSASTGWIVGTTESKGAGGEVTMTLQVWKTEDAGTHWHRQFQRSGTGLGSSGITFYDKNNGYLAIGNYDEMNGQLMRTTDGGAHWTEVRALRPARPSPMGIRLLSGTEGWIPLNVGAGPIDGGLLHFSKGGIEADMGHNGIWSLRDAVPTGSGTGWALADSMPGFRPTVLKTVDGGMSWKQVWPAPHPIADVTFVDDQHGFGIGRESEPGAFMRTADGGVIWQVVSDLGANGLRLYFADLKHGSVLGTMEDGTKPRLMETMDGGVTWRIVTESLPAWSSIPQTVEMKFFSDTEGMLALRDARELRVLRTEDGGKSWKAEPSITEESGVQTLVILSANELRETSLESQRDKTHWLQLSRLSFGEGSRLPLGRLIVGDSLLGAVYPSEQVGAILTPSWNEGKITLHLLSTKDGGRTWTDWAFPAVAGLDWSMAGRFSARGDSVWWLLIQGHLLRTNDAGGQWTIAY